MPVRVLIVDDQVSFRRAARNVVELTDGFELAGEVSSGEDSVEAARSMRPDLVLMDVRLPGMDGLEACRRILEGNAVGGSPPVIILVSAEQPSEPSESLDRCGAAAYMAKSEFGSERLVAVWTSATESA